MSKEAIRKFFRSQNRKAIRNNPPVVEVTAQNTEEVIMTGKSHDSETLSKYLAMFNDDQYVEPNTTDVVVEEPYKPDYSKYSIRLVDLTDEMIYKQEQEQAYREEEEYFKSFQEYVPPPRPREEIDERLNEFQYKLERCKKELDEELIKPIPNVKGYIPPTKKKEYNEQFNTNVKKLNSDIHNLENGIKELTVSINRKNDYWYECRKSSYRTEYIRKKLKELSAMQEEINNSSNLQMY
jgi:hypothetical protein